MNIYQIKSGLLSLLDLIEENDGELTPELEQLLQIHKDEFNDKIKDYTNAIKLLEDDCNAIKVEQKRLKNLFDKKQKIIDNLSKVVIQSIEEFGDTKKTGVRYINYGTGEISIRNTKAVEVDTDVLKAIGEGVVLTATYAKETNQLDVADKLDPQGVMKFVSMDTEDDDGNFVPGYTVTEEDLNHTQVQLSVKVPLAELFNGKSYNIIKEMAKRTNFFEVDAVVSKSILKKNLEENGACAPNIAKLVINKSIQIK